MTRPPRRKSAATPFHSIRERLSRRETLRVETPDLMETAVALILTPGERGLEALFIRRAERADDPWSGHIALPGGRREPADPDRFATAVRETAEEVGVALSRDHLLGPLDDLHPSAPRLPALVIRPFVFGLEARPETRLSEEVSGVEWIALSALAEREGRAEIAVRGERREVDCYRPNDLVIWGLTYRILRGFLPLAA